MFGQIAFSIFEHGKSPDESKIFTSFSNMSRNDYESLFVRHGISRRALADMTDSDYRGALAQILNEESSHPNYYAPEADSRYRYISPSLAAEERRMQEEYQSGYDEEEALRIAMMNSLEDQWNQYAHSPSMEPVNPEPVYQETMQHAQSEPDMASSSYSYVFKPHKEGPAPTTEAQQIVRDQDDEYRAACEEATRNEIHANSDLHFQENEAMIAEEEKNNKEGEVMRLYYQLPPEPAAGTTIATMLNGERLMRKFGLDEMAGDIYAWIAGENNLLDTPDKLYVDNFELRLPGGVVIDPNQTLAQQGLKGRIMVQVNVL